MFGPRRPLSRQAIHPTGPDQPPLMSVHLYKAVLFANRLLVLAVGDNGVVPASVVVGLRSGATEVPLIVHHGVPATISQFARLATAEPLDERTAFIAVALLSPEQAADVAAASMVRLDLRGTTGALAAADLEAEPIKAILPALRIEVLLLAMECPAVDRELSLLLECVCHTDRRPLDAHVDRQAVAPELGFLAHGWAANLWAHRPVFLLDDARVALPLQQAFPFARPDVSNHLAGTQGTYETQLHGFTLVAAAPGARHALVVALIRGTIAEMSLPIAVDGLRGPGELLHLASSLLPTGDRLKLAATGILDRLVRRNRQEPVATVTAFGPDSPVDLSVVVPFYRDSFFLLDHLESQRRAPPGTEWVIVCDDPGLAPGMTEMIRARAAVLERPTRLVILDRNSGFAAAANAGIREARGQHVLLLNSDVYWRSFVPFQRAATLLAETPSIGAVGFPLLFEDGMLQQAGAELARNAEFGGLWAAAHRGRGLPPSMPEDGEAVAVEAVSSACVMFRREEIVALGFDSDYVSGQFEDADLCLRLKRSGKAVVVLAAKELYHFERQSIAHSPGQDLLALADCARFNARWFESAPA